MINAIFTNEEGIVIGHGAFNIDEITNDSSGWKFRLSQGIVEPPVKRRLVLYVSNTMDKAIMMLKKYKSQIPLRVAEIAPWCTVETHIMKETRTSFTTSDNVEHRAVTLDKLKGYQSDEVYLDGSVSVADLHELVWPVVGWDTDKVFLEKVC